MVANLGDFIFEWQNITDMNFASESGIKGNDRIKNYPAYFRSTFGSRNITINGKTLPSHKDGNRRLEKLWELHNSGKELSFTLGTGDYLGKFVIMSISETRSVFLPSGEFLAQEFTLNLQKSDYGNISKR